MDLNELFTHVQGLFCKDMVTFVGSGTSAALGLPTMEKLAANLLEQCEGSKEIAGLEKMQTDEWNLIAASLHKGEGLEVAMDSRKLSDSLINTITRHVARSVRDAEMVAIAKMVTSPSPGVFTKLVKHLYKVDSNPSIITTNYDRLIEVDLTLNGIVVDSMFVGSTVGHFAPKSARYEHAIPGRKGRSAGNPPQSFREYVRLSKPHGSLDWMKVGDELFKSDLVASGPPLVITPGSRKFRLGYEDPFEPHRTRANEAITNAAALLVVGYGFNDDHLETQLRKQLKNVPTLIIARKLTPSVQVLLADNGEIVGVEEGSKPGTCRVIKGGVIDELDGPYWQLTELLAKVI